MPRKQNASYESEKNIRYAKHRGGSTSAKHVSFDKQNTDLNATDVQDALIEVNEKFKGLDVQAVKEYSEKAEASAVSASSFAQKSQEYSIQASQSAKQVEGVINIASTYANASKKSADNSAESERKAKEYSDLAQGYSQSAEQTYEKVKDKIDSYAYVEFDINERGELVVLAVNDTDVGYAINSRGEMEVVIDV